MPFTFTLTEFADFRGSRANQVLIDIDGLVDHIKGLVAPAKTDLPMVVLGTFGKQRSQAGSLRHQDNLETITGAVIDHDAATMPLQEAVDRLKASGLSFILHTTASNGLGKPRWRGLFPFSQPLLPSQLHRMTGRVNGLLGGAAARESFSPSNPWLIGRVDGVPFEIVAEDTGDFVDQADELDAGTIGRPSDPGATGKDFKTLDDVAVEQLIKTAKNYNGAAQELLWRWAKAGVSQGDAEANLFAVFDAVAQALRNAKYHQRRAQIPRWTARVYAKFSNKLKGPFGVIVTYFQESPDWQNAIRLNRLTETVEVCEPFPPEEGQTITEYRPLREPRDVLETMLYLQKNGIDARKGPVTDALILVAARRGYHPVKDWLVGLPEWDGEERLCGLFTDYFPTELPPETEADPTVERPGSPLTARAQKLAYLSGVGRVFLIAGVARMMQPGCKHDHLPILVGPQGWDKSRGLAALMPNPTWFLDDLSPNLASKESSEALIGKWLIELFEDRDQLWVEARHRYRQGEQWWLKPDIEGLAREQQARFVEEDSWDEAIADFLRVDARRTPRRPYRSLLPGDVLEKNTHLDPDIEPLTLREVVAALPTWCRDPVREGQRFTKPDEVRAARCLKRLGWEKFRDPDHRGSPLWRPATR